MSNYKNAHRAGAAIPGNAEGPTVAAVAPLEIQQSRPFDFRGERHSRQALQVIDGNNKAAQYLARLQAQQADPDELALIIAMLYGETLRGFCRAIAKALGVQHG